MQTGASEEADGVWQGDCMAGGGDKEAWWEEGGGCWDVGWGCEGGGTLSMRQERQSNAVSGIFPLKIDSLKSGQTR